MSTYSFVELVGTSTKSWEDAARLAIEDAQSEEDSLRVAEITRMDLKLIGDAYYYRVRLSASFKLPGAKS